MINNFLFSFATILRYMREVHELSQESMAIQLNISLRNYKRIELFEVTPSINLVFQVCNYFQLPIEQFFKPNTDYFKELEIIYEADNKSLFEIFELSRNDKINNFLKNDYFEEILNTHAFQNTTTPLAISSPRWSILNNAAVKLFNASTNKVKTNAGTDDQVKLAMLWNYLILNEIKFFKHLSSPKHDLKIASYCYFLKMNNKCYILSSPSLNTVCDR